MKEKLVSVIMPTYNRRDTIQAAIESVLFQTYKNIEVIVIDDASNDHTEEVIYAINDSRVHYYKNKFQQGANISRNIGIGHAEGEVIAFCDSADQWLSEKLEKQMKQMSETGAEIVFCAEKVISEEKVYMIPFATQKALIAQDRLKELLSKENCADTSTLLIRRECFDKVGKFHLELPRLQEYEWMIRAVQKCRIKYLDEVLVYAYIKKDSISSDLSKLLKAVPIIYQEHEKFFVSYDRQISFLISPLKQLKRANKQYETYLEYFNFLEEIVWKCPTECERKFYREAIRFLIEQDYVERCSTENKFQNHTFHGLIEKDFLPYCIFGAGEVARKLYCFLRGRKAEGAVKYIVVTSACDNSQTDFQLPIIDSVQCNKDIKAMPVVLAVSEDAVYEVLHDLRQKGFHDIICLTKEEREMIEGG